MFSFSHDKLTLGPDGMKAVANFLEQNDPTGRFARAAIMAGMRAGGGNSLIISDQDPAHRTTSSAALAKRVVFVKGSSGSGKSRLIQSWGLDSASLGHLSLNLSRRSPVLWSDEDSVNIIGDGSDAMITETYPVLKEALDKGDLQGVNFSVTEGSDYENFRYTVREIIRCLVRDRRERLLLTIDDLDWSDNLDALDEICDHADKAAGFRFVATSLVDEDLRAARYASAPTEILMRSVRADKDMFEGLERYALLPGVGIMTGASSQPRRISFPKFREDYLFRRSSVLPRAALSAIRRLDGAAKMRPMRTRTERLETVARCCGYRSWHAAQASTRKEVFL